MILFQWTKEALAFWALIISLISIGWQILIALTNKYSKAKIIIKIPPSNFEIIYGRIGPLFLLPLAYLSENKNAFVDTVEAVIKNVKTQEEHRFEARDFWEYRIDATERNAFPRLKVKEPFSPFGISTERYEKLAISFFDPQEAEVLTAGENKLNEEYYKIKAAHPNGVPNEIIDEFNQSSSVTETWINMQDRLYLKPGEYNVTIKSFVGKHKAEASFSFELSQKDYENLKLNALIVNQALKLDEEPKTLLSVFPRIKN